MKLVHLSVASIVACLLGLMILAKITLNVVGKTRANLEQVIESQALQARINGFSVTSDHLLLTGADAELLAAYREEGEALRQRLEKMGAESAVARETAHRVAQYLDTVTEVIRGRDEPEGTVPSLGPGALNLPTRSRIVMNQVAELGRAVDASFNTLLHERQRVIAREAWRIGGTLAGAALLFGALAVIAFLLIHRRVAAPARALVHTLNAIRSGDQKTRATVHGDDELSGIATTLNRMLDEHQALHFRLRKQNARLRQFQDLLEGSDDLCGIVNADYRYLWVNQEYRKRYGLPEEAIEGRTLPEIIGADYFERTVKPRVDRCLAGEVQRYETEREYPGMGWRKLLARYYPIDLPNRGERLIGAVITDVTEIRDAEAELTRQADLLDMAGRIARFGGWEVNLASGRCEWSNVVADIHGMPHGYSPPVGEGIAFYAPEHRERIRELFTACAEQGEPYDEELQIIDAHGQRLWVRALGEPVRDEQGGIVRVQGAFQDVTERRESDRQLRKLAHIIDQSPAAIAITDLEGRIEYLNPAFEEVSGYQSEELLGDTPARIQGGDTSDAVYRDLWGTITAGRVWKGELQNRRKDGTLYWESEVISPLRNEWGQTINYVAIKQDITALREAEQELNRIAFEDPLTGLYSRNGFTRQLQKQIGQDGWWATGAVVITDVAGLRDINDAHGYQAGDRLLIELGRRLVVQAGEEGFAGRIGGDEFTLLLLPDPGEWLETCLDRVVAFLSTPFELEGLEIEIAIRLGYTRLGEYRRPAEDLLREAELALFRHRRDYARPWVAYDASLERESQQRIALNRGLRQALNEDQFELHFQPKVDLATGTLVSCEALLRWNHPDKGLISPGVFIPIAEQSQLIVPIGDWVLRRACRHLRDWREAGLTGVRLAVNVSLVQFQTGDFASRVRAVLDQTGVAAEELALEITESVFEQTSESLLSQMRRLHAMGVRLSLDDFGTGYSSLMYLQRYPFDEIKIDQGFVFGLLDNPFSRHIIETILVLARALDAEVVAEGIESAEVADALLAMGCRFGQGYFYSMPLEAEDFRWLLEQRSDLPLTTKGVC